MANPAPITLQQLFKYYKGLPHQAAAIQQLETDLRRTATPPRCARSRMVRDMEPRRKADRPRRRDRAD
jgi:hypothetical protein